MHPYRTADDRIEGVVITFGDIAARKRAEDEIRLSQERLQAVLDQMPSVIDCRIWDLYGIGSDPREDTLQLTRNLAVDDQPSCRGLRLYGRKGAFEASTAACGRGAQPHHSYVCAALAADGYPACPK